MKLKIHLKEDTEYNQNDYIFLRLLPYLLGGFIIFVILLLTTSTKNFYHFTDLPVSAAIGDEN